MGTEPTPKLSNGNLVVVIGGTGFIGSHLVKTLQSKGLRVRVFARRPFESCPTELTAGLAFTDWFTGDICNPHALASACEGASAVFHMAGLAHVSTRNSAEIIRINMLGAKTLAEVCAGARTPRLIYLSSVLAAQPNASAYAFSKKQAENILLGASVLKQAGVHVTILRPTNVYGRGMRGNIRAMLRFIQRGLLPPLPKLDNRITLVSVADTCHAAFLAATKPHEAGQIFSITDGENYTPNLIESAAYVALNRKRPRWRTPRMLLFVLSAAAESLNKLGIWQNDLGLRTYNNLTADRPLTAPAEINQLGFVPTQTLYTQMQDILENLP